MTQLTEPLSPPFHLRLLDQARRVGDEAAKVCDEARKDRRAVTGAVAALGVGLLLGLFLKPTAADGDPSRSTASGVSAVEPGFVRTEGIDILVSARTSPEGRVPRVHGLLEAPVFGDPGRVPLPVQRVTHIVEPDGAVLIDEPEPVIFDEPPILPCEDNCLETMEPPPESEGLL